MVKSGTPAASRAVATVGIDMIWDTRFSLPKMGTIVTPREVSRALRGSTLELVNEATAVREVRNPALGVVITISSRCIVIGNSFWD